MAWRFVAVRQDLQDEPREDRQTDREKAVRSNLFIFVFSLIITFPNLGYILLERERGREREKERGDADGLGSTD